MRCSSASWAARRASAAATGSGTAVASGWKRQPGKYRVYAFHGPFFTIPRETVELTGGKRELTFTLRELPLRPKGTVSADLHVHGSASFDSSIPDRDRVLSFAASDVEIVVATDHDVVFSYDDQAVTDELGITGRFFAIVGVETTGHVPFLKVPGDMFPRVIGHYNFWPLHLQASAPRNGGPFDEFVEPGELFDRVEPLLSGLGIFSSG